MFSQRLPTAALRFTLVVLGAVAVAPVAAQAWERLVNVNTVYDLSADGAIVVGRVSAPAGTGAGYWSNGAVTLLDPLPSGQRADRVVVVTPDGSVMAGCGPAFRFDGNSLVEIVPPGGGGSACVAAISDDGSIVTGNFSSPSGAQVFRWSAGVATPMTLPPGTSECTASGISADGAVIIGDCQTPTGTVTFRWDDGGAVTLAPNSGFTHCAPTDVSADGAVVVGTCDHGTTASARAYRWENAAVTLLSTPGAWSRAQCVSADGSIIVGESADCAYRDERDVTTCLDDVADLYPSPYLYSVDYNINGCSDDAMVVAAEGVVTYFDGNWEMWSYWYNWVHASFEGWRTTCAQTGIHISRDGTTFVGYAFDGLAGWYRCSYPRTDCDHDGMADDLEIAADSALDCDYNHILDVCEQIVDCNSNAVKDSCDLAQGTSRDCNADAIPDDCQVDCNGSQTPDDCDITAGSSADCNQSGRPDECEIAAGSAIDADGDGRIDACALDCALPALLAPSFVERWMSDTPQFNAVYGFRVAIDGHVAIVGAPQENNGRGAAYLYRYDGANWRLVQHLTRPEPGFPWRFGAAVAVSGLRVAVGTADGAISGKVAVYHLEGETWVEESIIGNVGLTTSAVALQDRTLLVGGADNTRIFEYAAGAWTQTFLHPHLGTTVALSGNYAVAVQKPLWNDICTARATVFKRSAQGWHAVAEFTPDQQTCDYIYGESVAIDGETIAVGAPVHKWAEDWRPGSVYLYQLNAGQWRFLAQLGPALALDHAAFGSAVALRGSTLLVGAPASGGGYVHLYRGRDAGWDETLRFRPSIAPATAYFGNSMALDGSRALIGAGLEHGVEPQQGAAYLYSVPVIADCNRNLVQDDCDILAGTSADLDRNLVPDECQDDCNANGVIDIVEVPANDCNANGLADECDADCDGNGIVDACEGAPAMTVDPNDPEAFARCLSGPWVFHGLLHSDCLAGCRAAFDLDADGDIDLVDFSAQQAAAGG